jgi:AcrR family transcriptional regulator
MSDRKKQLLDAAIRYLRDHGLADLSLRPLAAKIGSSARLLVFHFGSKEGLVADMLNEVQARMQASFATVLDEPATDAQVAPMKRFWLWATSKQNLPYLRLMYEAHFIALQNPRVYSHYLGQYSLNWVEIIQARLPDGLRNDETATLCGAVFDGLVIELLGTGDLARTTRALDRFIVQMRRELAAGSQPSSVPKSARKNPPAKARRTTSAP